VDSTPSYHGLGFFFALFLVYGVDHAFAILPFLSCVHLHARTTAPYGGINPVGLP
jgi:hypothetical protein